MPHDPRPFAGLFLVNQSKYEGRCGPCAWTSPTGPTRKAAALKEVRQHNRAKHPDRFPPKK